MFGTVVVWWEECGVVRLGIEIEVFGVGWGEVGDALEWSVRFVGVTSVWWRFRVFGVLVRGDGASIGEGALGSAERQRGGAEEVAR